MVHQCDCQTFEAAAPSALYLPGPSESPFQYRIQNQACRQGQWCVRQLQGLSVTVQCSKSGGLPLLVGRVPTNPVIVAAGAGTAEC